MKHLSWIFLLTAALLSGCSKPGNTDDNNQTGVSVGYSTAADFDKAMNGDKPVLVDFFATW